MNKTDLYLRTHTQFGDHIICYGFVKEFSKNFDKIFLYTKQGEQHINNIKRVYESIPNVILSPDLDINKFNVVIGCNKEWYDTTNKWFRNPNLPLHNKDLVFDRLWYSLAGVVFRYKWDNFYFKRNIEKEKEVYYDVLGLKDNEEFIFLQDDSQRNFNIDKSLINADFKIIESFKHQEISLLDSLYIIEKAKEVHVINSGLLSFIDLMKINHKNLYYHRYTRPFPVEQVTLRLNWKIL